MPPPDLVSREQAINPSIQDGINFEYTAFRLHQQSAAEHEVAARLGHAANWIEANVVGRSRWFGTVLMGAEDNQPIAPRLVEGGSSTLVYGGIPFRLEDGMALVIEIEDPRAEYFSFQTYRKGWFHPGDYANRQTSLNSRQTQLDSDGKIRLVASPEDPRVPNWLNTEQREEAHASRTANRT